MYLGEDLRLRAESIQGYERGDTFYSYSGSEVEGTAPSVPGTKTPIRQAYMITLHSSFADVVFPSKILRGQVPVMLSEELPNRLVSTRHAVITNENESVTGISRVC